MRKAALHNLGCKVNAYETEAMQQILEAAGYEIVPFHNRADVYIINTCSVTNIADRKSRQMLHRAKKQNPAAVVVAAGCYVQAAEELKQDLAVDIIIGNNKKAELARILEDYFAGHPGPAGECPAGERLPGEGLAEPAVRGEAERHVINIAETKEYEPLGINRIGGHTRAFIKVQDGCNQFCSYCIIPYTRGRVRSRKPAEAEAEAVRLAGQGYQEIVLAGIHLSSYGVDFPEAEAESLLELIRRLHNVEGLRRIRLGSLEPRVMTENFVRELAKMEKLCPHFHLSLQSGCDATLKRMNRRYTVAEYEARCRLLREEFDHPAITTDVIVGFPGETEEEFAQTRAFLERLCFYEMHVFKYSRRAGTRAAAMPDQVPEAVKNARSDVLLALAQQMSADYRRSMIGARREVLLEEPVTIQGQDYMAGYTREYVKTVVSCADGGKNSIIRGILTGMLDDQTLVLK